METGSSSLAEASTRPGMETLEASTRMENNAEFSETALQLQRKLQQLRVKLVKARAMREVADGMQPVEDGANNVLEEETAKKLNTLTKKRTETFLNFQGIQLAIQAGQANQALAQALNLETEGDVKLEAEEEEYVRGLLEEQRELACALTKSNQEEVEGELQVMTREAELAQLYVSYRNQAEKTVVSRKQTKETWDEQTKKVERAIMEGDYKLNQLRFTIQKFMISHDKFGLQFDEATNATFETLLLRCGAQPEALREELERAAMTPAAAGGEFAMEQAD
jgi:hypothetical protein